MAVWRNRLALAKIESTYNTSSAPANTDALLFTELDVQPLAVELAERSTIQSYFGNRASIVTKRMVPVKSTVELAASGTAGTAPRWGPLLRSCAAGEAIVATTSVTYSPVSSAFSSYTMDFYKDDGARQLITGIRGTAELSMSLGSIPTLSFDQMGQYTAPAALTLPTPTYTTQASPVAVNSDNTTAVSVHGFSACLSDFSFSFGVATTFRQLAGCAKEVLVTGRQPTGSLTIELPNYATKDFLAIVSAQTTGSISWQHGQTAGNIITFTASTCAFDTPSIQEMEAITMITLPFRPLPTSAGNNEWSLALT
ncbi:MAG: phage tail tube protein [Synechococcus sp. ELA057]|jgi:hypothetical protein